MKADTLNFAKLFGADVQYVVPMFQRPYVWEKEKQWEPLWQDVMDVVEALQEAYVQHKDKADAEASVAPHFLGAVVLDPLPTGAGQVDSRHVIDGQQRLTTLQLLIAAVHAVAGEHQELARHQRVLEKLIRNDEDLLDDQRPHQRFKVWPTKFDRDSFGSAITGDPAAPGRPTEAYRFFHLMCSDWAAEAATAGELVERFDALQAVLRSFLKLVAIDLEPNDNAQAIFEVLNARGTELLAVDLVKNLAFRVAQERKENVDHLYHTFWEKFDSRPWRRPVVVGRLTKARADQFLTYWLVMKTARDVHAQQLFPTFRQLLQQDSASILSLIADLSMHADEFDRFGASPSGAYPITSPEGLFFYRITEIDINVFMPILLLLFGLDSNTLPFERRRWVLSALESWLMRRMLLRAPTKDYNKVVPMLISRVQEEPAAAAEVIVDSLQRVEGPNRTWPTDEEVRNHLRGDPVYISLKRARLRIVLEAIENHRRGNKAEEQVPVKKLHIEHVLPQSWPENWPLPPDASPIAAAERDIALHRLGNLTLLTRELNSAQSNSSWTEKRALLEEFTVLKINKQLLEHDTWDETVIATRTDQLIEAILEIWPGPSAEVWHHPV
ncbi:MAG: DUF262 domain-containing protein [Gemmatimonadetes bacterium]|jgi:hypothetical protein|nr:DUF262 domain-containing protein [Gemmatimonadota bacterium]MBA4159932.1 DUF262 domain-containing protein [Gemmatimonadota bacterium]